MARESFLIPDPLQTYIDQTWTRPPEILKELRDEIAPMPEAGLQISPDQGQFLAMLVKLIGAKRCLEIGVFTGYSSLSVALALPEDGKMLALDISEEYTKVARRYWAKAGVAHKIDLRIAPALDSLVALPKDTEPFDFCFIDADKDNYWNYFDHAVRLVRPSGLIVMDNVLRNGSVIDLADEGAHGIRDFNRKVAQDPRVDDCLVPIGDGFTLARVR